MRPIVRTPPREQAIGHAVGDARRAAVEQIGRLDLHHFVVVVEGRRPLNRERRLDHVLEALGIAVVGRVPDAREDGPGIVVCTSSMWRLTDSSTFCSDEAGSSDSLQNVLRQAMEVRALRNGHAVSGI